MGVSRRVLVQAVHGGGHRRQARAERDPYSRIYRVLYPEAEAGIPRLDGVYAQGVTASGFTSEGQGDMRRAVSERQEPLNKFLVQTLTGTYRFCKTHRLRPYRCIARTVTRLFPQSRYCIVELYPDVHFRIDLLDGYWTNLL